MGKDLIETNLHPRDYHQKEVYRIVNYKQAKLYIKNRVFPIDMYASIDKNNNDVIVYVFLRDETKELYQLWQSYELE